MNPPGPYIMESAGEGQRLLDKVDARSWISTYLENYLPGVRSVLSVGCGPGVFLKELAGSHPNIDFVGVDISDRRVQEAKWNLEGVPNARVLLGDAQALPFESFSFDLVFCRFLMEYVLQKELALREITRVCRGGGRVLLQDLDGQLLWHFPEDLPLQQKIEQVVERLAATGFDPFVGRKLFNLCFRAGLINLGARLDPYHFYAGAIDDKEWSLWRRKLEIVRPLVKEILGSEDAALEYSEKFLSYLKRPDTLTYSCLFTVTGCKVPASTENDLITR